MKDGVGILDYNDLCPVHGGPEYRTLEIGERHVIIFVGCNCAVLCEDGRAYYYSQFVGAQSVAVMREHMADAEEW